MSSSPASRNKRGRPSGKTDGALKRQFRTARAPGSIDTAVSHKMRSNTPAAKVPQRGPNSSAAPRHPSHLLHRQLRSGNEHQDELGGSAGELPVTIRERTGIADLELRLLSRSEGTCVGNERGGKVDSDDAPTGPSLCHCEGQHAGAAAHIEEVAAV